MTKTTRGKRLAVLLVGAGFFGLSLYLPFVPVRESIVQVVCKWGVNIAFFAGGLWLVYVGLRGERRQVNKEFDSMMDGL